MVRSLITVALGLAVAAAPAQPQAPSPARRTEGPDFRGLLKDIQTAQQWRASLPAGAQHVGPHGPIWGVYPTIYPEGDIYPIVDPMSEYEVTTIPARTLTPQPPPSEEELLAMRWVVNINTASPAELARVPLIDPLRAEAIVTHRTANGPFAHPTEILDVFGITAPIFEALHSHLVCEGESTLSTAVDRRPVSPTTQPGTGETE